MARGGNHPARRLTSSGASPFLEGDSMKRFLVLGALTVGLSPIGLSAQQAQDTTQLKELVVTANGTPTPADAVVSTVTTITRDELRDRGIQFVQDALRDIPGATVTQS